MVEYFALCLIIYRQLNKKQYNKDSFEIACEVIFLKIHTKIDFDIEDNSVEIIAKSKDDLKQILDVLRNIDDTIDAKQEDKLSQIRYSEILYFENVEKKTVAYTLKNVYEISKWLNEIEEIMPKSFFRCSKTTIINLAKVKSFSPSFGSKIVMNLIDGEKIYVSRKFVKPLNKKMNGGKLK